MTSVRASCVSIGIVTGARSSTVILDEERSGFEGQVAVNHDANPLISGAGDRDRTGTGLAAHGILSPRRLPIPPLRRWWTIVESIQEAKKDSSEVA